MSVYATRDSDGGHIARDASIHRFDTVAEARAWLLKPYDPGDWRHDSVQIEAGRYCDCWVKLLAPPRTAGSALPPFARRQLYVQRPGEHPGGRFWWVTPAPDVLVVAHIEEIES